MSLLKQNNPSKSYPGCLMCEHEVPHKQCFFPGKKGLNMEQKPSLYARKMLRGRGRHHAISRHKKSR